MWWHSLCYMAQNECYNTMYAVKKVLNIFANVKSNSNLIIKK